MTTFDKREDAFEKQFAHDEELRFKATARRNKALGLWADHIKVIATGAGEKPRRRLPRTTAVATENPTPALTRWARA